MSRPESQGYFPSPRRSWRYKTLPPPPAAGSRRSKGEERMGEERGWQGEKMDRRENITVGRRSRTAQPCVLLKQLYATSVDRLPPALEDETFHAAHSSFRALPPPPCSGLAGGRASCLYSLQTKQHPSRPSPSTSEPPPLSSRCSSLTRRALPHASHCRKFVSAKLLRCLSPDSLLLFLLGPLPLSHLPSHLVLLFSLLSPSLSSSCLPSHPGRLLSSLLGAPIITWCNTRRDPGTRSLPPGSNGLQCSLCRTS
eukprot:666657-Hanusia_phi.AAC.1